MATRVGATPEQLLSAAGRMHELSTRMTGIANRLQSALSAQGAAWGNDSYGSAFTDGPQGYTAAHTNLETGFRDLATTLQSYADGQVQAAGTLAGMEHRNRAGFGGA